MSNHWTWKTHKARCNFPQILVHIVFTTTSLSTSIFFRHSNALHSVGKILWFLAPYIRTLWKPQRKRNFAPCIFENSHVGERERETERVSSFNQIMNEGTGDEKFTKEEVKAAFFPLKHAVTSLCLLGDVKCQPPTDKSRLSGGKAKLYTLCHYNLQNVSTIFT